jgi:hypothetical protein
MSDDTLIASLTAAVEVRPDDLRLRLHLGGLLVEAGRAEEAIGHAAQVLARDSGNVEAQALMQRALSPPPSGGAPGEAVDDTLSALENELSQVLPPRFAPAPDDTTGDRGGVQASAEPEPVRGDDDRMFDVEASTVRLADVGGMAEVK